MILRNVTITIAEIEISESPARPAGERPGTRGNEPGLAPLAAEAAEQPTATVAAVGGSETVASSGSAPPEVTLTVLDEPTVAALLADVGKRVLAAVENPPAPEVDLPAELPLRRPVEEDTLDFPAILDRRAGRAS